MMNKNIFVICCLLLMNLILAGCDSRQLPTSTIPVVPTFTIPVVPTSTIPVEIISVIVEPSVVKNGDSFFLQVNASPGGLPIKSDLSQLDSTQKRPAILGASGQDNYSAKLTISYGNTAENGVKTITIISADSSGKTVTETIQIELRNPAPVLDKVPPNDNFNKAALDLSKWKFDNSSGGQVEQADGRLSLSTDNKESYSWPRIRSTWLFPGDFDIQVDFQSGDGWRTPATNHIDAAVLGVEIDGHLYHITRLIRGPNEGSKTNIIMAWNDLATASPENPVQALSGNFRLIRVGTSLVYLYDVGDGWVELAIIPVPASLARVYLGPCSVFASQIFTTYFDNFLINSGQTIR